MIKHYGFIVKAKSYDYPHDKTVMDTTEFFTEVIGVSNDHDAVLAAKGMIERGVQVIELCGGFGLESAEEIISQLDTDIPVGYVTFNERENQKLVRIMSQSPDA
ncbi:DUF6506 family protein [Microbulbifer spongiae]|uniref:DUF6506 family protein n=1 Tax=Microbulbifer spongiae TaxID=2944933 RepID=A0ABY9EHI6_9GAMM|nr:DUF6506 family protein [Microbulbifer sp. MI-G]WKD51304.1 DUF6506 family protein [Microbulbifer sp. MI-G]